MVGGSNGARRKEAGRWGQGRGGDGGAVEEGEGVRCGRGQLLIGPAGSKWEDRDVAM